MVPTCPEQSTEPCSGIRAAGRAAGTGQGARTGAPEPGPLGGTGEARGRSPGAQPRVGRLATCSCLRCHTSLCQCHGDMAPVMQRFGHAPKRPPVTRQANTGASPKASSGGHLPPSPALARDPGQRPLSLCDETANRSNQPEQSGRWLEWPCMQMGPGEVAPGARTCPRLSVAYSPTQPCWKVTVGGGGGLLPRAHPGESQQQRPPRRWPLAGRAIASALPAPPPLRSFPRGC